MKAYLRQDIPAKQYILDGRRDSYMEGMAGIAGKEYDITSMDNEPNWYNVTVTVDNSTLTYNYHRSWLLFPNEMDALTIPEPLVSVIF